MAARDFERAAVMIEENIVGIFSRSEVPVLLSWIKKLPAQLVRSHPWIDVYHANTLVLAGRLDEVDALLADVEKRIAPGASQAAELSGHIAAVRAYAANLRGDAARTIEMAALTKQYLPEGHLTAQGMAAYALADTFIASDDMEGASHALLDVLDIGTKTDQLMMTVQALSELAFVSKVQGRLHQAEERYARAYQWMIEKNGMDARVRCAYEFGMADLLCERNQLDAAYEHIKVAIAYRQRLGGYWVVGDMVVMRVLHARGDVEGALDALHSAELITQTHHFQIAALIGFHTSRVMLWLAVGDIDMAARAAEACSSGSEREQIALARLRIAQENFIDALDLLERQRVLAEAGGRDGRLIEIMGLQAVALDMLGKPDEAEGVLIQALFLAWQEGYVRVFLDMGLPLQKLLARLAARGDVQSSVVMGYVHNLLLGFEGEKALQPDLSSGQNFRQSHHAEAFFEPLTRRELEVLHLLAEGISNKEIASRLFVEPSTVKQHLKSIYAKLNAHSRTQAVTRGRELALL
jgi:LuxR family maltose regulon positive regulatory protein